MVRFYRLEARLTEAQLNELMQDPANKSLLQPIIKWCYVEEYDDINLNPTHLFNAIGVALYFGNETERLEAFWVLKALMPELDEILHVRKKTQEDFIEHLLKVLVTERSFSLEEGKDPRPFVRRMAKNWKRDGLRKEGRILSLDKPQVGDDEGTALRSILPSPVSLEDQLLDHLLEEEFHAKLDFLTKDERFVIEAGVANLPTKVIARELGMTEDRVRGHKARAKRKIRGQEELRVFFPSKTDSLYCQPYPLRVAKKERASSVIRRRVGRIIGLFQLIRRMLAIFHTKKLRE